MCSNLSAAQGELDFKYKFHHSSAFLNYSVVLIMCTVELIKVPCDPSPTPTPPFNSSFVSFINTGHSFLSALVSAGLGQADTFSHLLLPLHLIFTSARRKAILSLIYLGSSYTPIRIYLAGLLFICS